MSATGKRNLIFSFDVGHSSIGWNVLKETGGSPEEVALGTVTFEADGCLASKRRVHRGMRRNIRSCRLRITDIEKLFIHQGILTEAQVEEKHQPGSGNSSPWLLAAAVLAGNGAFSLTADELFDVVRWYAHNRGYDGNRRWAGNADDEEGDSNREKAAFALMDQHKTLTMAETICAQLGLKPGGHKKASMAAYKDSEIGAAFPRKTVVNEVTRILRLHVGKISGCTDEFIDALCGEGDDAWKAIEIDGLEKPKTYRGNLLFGQKVPRFDNRILSFCPVSNKPTPLKSCVEFIEFRGAMFLSNVRVGSEGSFELRPLSADELNALWRQIKEHGYLTAKQFEKAVRALDDVTKDNLQALMMIEQADKNLVVDPALKLISSSTVLKPLIPLLSDSAREDVLSKLRKKNVLTVAEILAGVPESEELSEALGSAFKKESKKVQGKYGNMSRWREERTFVASFDSGRAPYGRPVMKRAVEQILSGKDPRAEGGCLYLTEEMLKSQENRSLADLTNNHLVRHRLMILQRLFKDMVDEFCDGEKERILSVVVEVNREVSEMSGKSMKLIKQEEGLKRADHKKARLLMEKAVEEAGENVRIGAGLIRKARIAQDQGWKCPYTGKEFEPLDLIHKQVDLDHIIPRSERLSDSMAGLVVTFSEINRWKGARTAYQFISEEQGKKVSGKPSLTIWSLNSYEGYVSKLKIGGGHDSDVARRKARKGYLLLPSYQDKEFTPRDLTISSYVAKLAVQQIKKEFSELPKKPPVISLPGRLTGEARKSWKLFGLLSAVNNDISSDTPKNDIRGLTHLHHALDAAVMGLMAHCADNLSDGTTWQLLLKRSLSAEEKTRLKANMSNIEFDSKGRAHLRDIPNEIKSQLRKCLMERRVVQHVPASMDGLKVEENTRGIISVDKETGKVKLRQSGKETEEVAGKLVRGTKLSAQNGARVINQNFGVALSNPPQIITWHKVYPKLQAIKEETGKWPQVLRNGMLIYVPKGNYAKVSKVWKIFSVKNEARYPAVDMGFPDSVKPVKRGVNLNTLVRDGLSLVRGDFSGEEICRITSSTSEVQQ
jgi:CRISPR-associated endonuclease Csn1